jgi:hypothetical protein
VRPDGRRATERPDRAEIHEGRSSEIAAGRLRQHDAERRLPGRRGIAHATGERRRPTGGVDDEPGVEVGATVDDDAVAAGVGPRRRRPHRPDTADDVLEVAPQVTSQHRVVEHAVGTSNLDRTLGVDGDDVDAGLQQLVVGRQLDAGEVVDPRRIRRRPGVVGADEHDVETEPAALRRQGAAGGAVADDRDVDRAG